MEGAGKLIDDEELREAMRAKGLGTPATRAATIEGLIFQEYVRRQGRELIATAKGMALITLLRGIDVAELCSPEMTGEWEHKLKQIQEGVMKPKAFMTQIKDFTREIVEKAKNFDGDSVGGNFVELNVKCPKCGGGPFQEDYRTYKCRSCGLMIWKTMAGRLFDSAEVETLLTQGKVGPLDGFRSKMGRPFSAVVKLGEDFKQQFDFPESDQNAAIVIDPAKHEALGLCPVCGKGQVYVLDNSFACERAVSSPKDVYFPRRQSDFAKGNSQGAGSEVDCDWQDRSASEIHFEERPSFFRALEIGEGQSRFRVCRTCTQAEKIRRAKVRGRRVSVATASFRRRRVQQDRPD